MFAVSKSPPVLICKKPGSSEPGQRQTSPFEQDQRTLPVANDGQESLNVSLPSNNPSSYWNRNETEHALTFPLYLMVQTVILPMSTRGDLYIHTEPTSISQKPISIPSCSHDLHIPAPQALVGKVARTSQVREYVVQVVSKGGRKKEQSSIL